MFHEVESYVVEFLLEDVGEVGYSNCRSVWKDVKSGG